jgi:hypothetical protein
VLAERFDVGVPRQVLDRLELHPALVKQRSIASTK